MTSASPVPASRDDWVGPLDGIRGLAALWVLLGHAYRLCGQGSDLHAHTAVEVFIVVSGFLMTHHFVKRAGVEPWGTPRTWGIFYLRRFFRIAPLYYVLLAVALALAGQFDAIRSRIDQTLGLAGRRYEPATMMNWLTHVTFTFGGLPEYAQSTVLPDWSIGLEMQFYVAFPFLMLIALRYSPMGLALACLLVSEVARRTIGGLFPMPTLLPLKLHLFAVGILLAIAFNERRNLAHRLALVLTALVVCEMNDNRLLVLLVCGLALVVLIPAGAVGDAASFSGSRAIARAQSLLGGWAATFLADMSYAVYLLHLMVMIPLIGWLIQHDWFLRWGIGPRLALVVPATVALTYAGAYLLHLWVERPGIHLGKWLIRRLGEPRPVPVPVLEQKVGAA